MFPGQEFIYVNFQYSAKFKHDGCIREALACLPFGNCSVSNTELFRDGSLSKTFLFSAFRYELSDLDLIQF